MCCAPELDHEIRLPKGHVEAGKTDAEAALREVCEETGYCTTRGIVTDLGEAVTEFTWKTQVRRNERYFMRPVNLTPGPPHFDKSRTAEDRASVPAGLPAWRRPRICSRTTPSVTSSTTRCWPTAISYRR